MFAWVAACPAGACLPMPSLIRLALLWVGWLVSQAPASPCSLPAFHAGELFRVDAKAEGPHRLGRLGHGIVSASLDREMVLSPPAPGQRPMGVRGRRALPRHRIIGALGRPGRGHNAPACAARPRFNGVVEFSAGTDNQENQFLAESQLTPKYPLCTVLMELVTQLASRNILLRLQWRPRETNTEVDALTNEDYEGFSISNRVAVELEKLPFKVLPDMLRAGAGFREEVRQRKAAQPAPAEVRAPKRARLRERDPWA